MVLSDLQFSSIEQWYLPCPLECQSPSLVKVHASCQLTSWTSIMFVQCCVVHFPAHGNRSSRGVNSRGYTSIVLYMAQKGTLALEHSSTLALDLIISQILSECSRTICRFGIVVSFSLYIGIGAKCLSTTCACICTWFNFVLTPLLFDSVSCMIFRQLQLITKHSSSRSHASVLQQSNAL